MNGILVDENLPHSLRLPTSLPVTHATQLGESLSDTQLWANAREERLILVTKDADFTHRIFLSSPPPWVVHVRLHNLRLRALTAHLATIWPQVESLLPAHKLVSILPDRIEAVR